MIGDLLHGEEEMTVSDLKRKIEEYSMGLYDVHAHDLDTNSLFEAAEDYFKDTGFCQERMEEDGLRYYVQNAAVAGVEQKAKELAVSDLDCLDPGTKDGAILIVSSLDGLGGNEIESCWIEDSIVGYTVFYGNRYDIEDIREREER
jgi:hypothetical protein